MLRWGFVDLKGIEEEVSEDLMVQEKRLGFGRCGGESVKNCRLAFSKRYIECISTQDFLRGKIERVLACHVVFPPN